MSLNKLQSSGLRWLIELQQHTLLPGHYEIWTSVDVMDMEGQLLYVEEAGVII